MNPITTTAERIVRVTDILEQIKSVDEMIELHKQKGDGQDMMLLEYEYRRESFLKALRETLEELNIKPTDLAA